MSGETPELCPKCLGVGTIKVRGDQLGWLHRTDLEDAETKRMRVQIWELPTGSFYPLNWPYEMRARCPVCSPKRRDGGLMSAFLGDR